MVLVSFWGAELLFLGGQASTRSQTPAEVCREQGFTKCRDLLGTDICRTWVCRGQHFSGNRRSHGTGVCRGQRFAGDRGLQGGCKLPPSQAPGLCAWLLTPEFWLFLPSPCQCQGFWVVTGL